MFYLVTYLQNCLKLYNIYEYLSLKLLKVWCCLIKYTYIDS